MVSLMAFPALIGPTKDPTDIVVEVYEVRNEAIAKALDRLEGHPGFYDRQIVELEDGRKGWVYCFSEDSGYSGRDKVACGDWVKYSMKGGSGSEPGFIF